MRLAETSRMLLRREISSDLGSASARWRGTARAGIRATDGEGARGTP
jgi:hypothetical protein